MPELLGGVGGKIALASGAGMAVDAVVRLGALLLQAAVLAGKQLGHLLVGLGLRHRMLQGALAECGDRQPTLAFGGLALGGVGDRRQPVGGQLRLEHEALRAGVAHYGKRLAFGVACQQALQPGLAVAVAQRPAQLAKQRVA